jgi:NhaD family Na+/H+ antiporter
MKQLVTAIVGIALLALPLSVFAETIAIESFLLLTRSWVGYTSLTVFILAYALVAAEEFTHLRKSKPVILAAGAIWAMIGFAYAQAGIDHAAEEAVKIFIVEFGELFMFLLVAMTYVNAMKERRVFEGLRVWLASRGYSFRRLFLITGLISFCLSPIIDNLTTALVISAVVIAVGKNNSKFVGLGCINIVVAANAGGAFSPFGDITTLMVWQSGIVQFNGFFALFIPSLINYAVPATAMYFAVPNKMPEAEDETVRVKRGAFVIIFLFFLTITTAVCFHNFLHLPPFLGMVTGLGYLNFYGYYLKRSHVPHPKDSTMHGEVGDVEPFDSLKGVQNAEWDTLLFFFGVIMCVGGLGFIGYLSEISAWMYGDLGPTFANILVGLMSAVVDNIPVMVAVLQMNPVMNESQWLLVTLTAGVGGSLLSIGSAAGVALMGQARGDYTFFGHLKWSPVIALGYFASISLHLWLNS